MAYCKNCGHKTQENTAFCVNCGTTTDYLQTGQIESGTSISCAVCGASIVVAQCKGGCGKYLCKNCVSEAGGYCSDCIDESIKQIHRIAKGDIKGFIIGGIIGGLILALCMCMGSMSLFLQLFRSYFFTVGLGVIGVRWIYRKGWIVWGWLFFFVFPLVGLCVIFKDVSILLKYRSVK